MFLLIDVSCFFYMKDNIGLRQTLLIIFKVVEMIPVTVKLKDTLPLVKLHAVCMFHNLAPAAPGSYIFQKETNIQCTVKSVFK